MHLTLRSFAPFLKLILVFLLFIAAFHAVGFLVPRFHMLNVFLIAFFFFILRSQRHALLAAWGLGIGADALLPYPYGGFPMIFLFLFLGLRFIDSFLLQDIFLWKIAKIICGNIFFWLFVFMMFYLELARGDAEISVALMPIRLWGSSFFVSTLILLLFFFGNQFLSKSRLSPRI